VLRRDAEWDPSYSQYEGAYSGTINDYLRRELKFESDLPYEVLTGRVHPWNFGRGGSGYTYVADRLRQAMIKNPYLKVLVASGYHDLATPYFATKYTVDHMDLSPELRKNVTETFYPGGHMMYHRIESLKKLNGDVKSFIAEATGQQDRVAGERPDQR
jgi:carboxypeptidase C (cathepsin A)